MAFGILYYNDIPNSLRWGNTVRVEILERDYTGAQTQIKMNPIVSLSNSGDGREEPIKKKTCELKILSERSLQFEHLFTSDDRKYQVKVYYDSAVVFVGFLESDSYEEPYAFYQNYEITLTARDNLGRLEDIEYLTISGERQIGLQRIDQVLSYVLLQTGNSLLSNDFVNIYASGQNELLPTFGQTYVNVSGFWNEDENEPISCLEVLERILKGYGAQIRQIEETWEIVEQGKYYDNNTIDVDDSIPRFITNTINTSPVPNETFWLDQSANLVLEPAWKSFKLKQDFLYNEKIFPFPSDDSEYTPTSPILATINNWVQDIDVYYTKNAGFFAIPPRQAVDPQSKIYREVNVNSTTNTVLLQFTFGLANRARLLDPEPTLVSESGSGCDLYFDVINISTSGNQILTPSGWVAYTTQTRELSFTGVNTGDLSILIDGIPNDGQLRIVFWDESDGKFTTPGGGILTWGIAYESIKLTFNTGSKLADLFADINTNNNFSDEFDFKIGEVPSVNNSQLVYLGGLFDSSGIALEDFKRPGDTTARSLLRVVAEGYDLMNNKKSRKITGSLFWKWDFNTNIKDQRKNFLLNAGDWDLVNDRIDNAGFIEVFEYKNTPGAFDQGYDEGYDNQDVSDYSTNSTFQITEKFE